VLRVPLPFYLTPRPGSARLAPCQRSWIGRLVRRWAQRWLFIPDLLGPWAIGAARRAAEEHCIDPFGLVITSSPQESSHWIGRSLQRSFGCPWLADFRDGWTFDPHRPEVQLPLRGRIEAMMERSVVNHADWITAATRPLAQDFRARFPHRADRVHFLPTGFGEFPTAREPQSDDVFRLVYTGRFGLSRRVQTPERFLAGLRRALDGNPAFARRFRLVLVGDFLREERALWSRPPLSACVEQHGPYPYEQAMHIAAGATMLLLVTPPGLRSIATRKLFDYLAVRRPVFALAHGNEAARILEETRAGICVPPDDVGAIASGLCRAFGFWREGVLDREIPCSVNDLYRAEPHVNRVLGNLVLPAMAAMKPARLRPAFAVASPVGIK